MTDEQQRQPYDSALKSLLEDHVAEILPEILPESELVSEQNAEIARTNLRPDLVYLIRYRDEPHILNLELQTNLDRSEEHTSELQSHLNLVCRLLLEKKKRN